MGEEADFNRLSFDSIQQPTNKQMGKTFRKNPVFGGGTSASHVRRYRTHNRSKGAGVVNASTEEFLRGRNYRKSAFAWNTSPHGRSEPGLKGMPSAYTESAKARRQQQIARRKRWVEDDEEVRDHEEVRDRKEVCDHGDDHKGIAACFEFNAQELAAIAAWSSPLIVKLGSDLFRMVDTYTYTLLEDGAQPTPCLARKIGNKYYVIALDCLMDYPDLAYDDDLWMVHSIGIVLWEWSTPLILPEDKNASDLVGTFVNF